MNLVIPVPIGAARKKERGYNQAALLAWPLAVGSAIPYCSQGLIKTRDTPSQVGLDSQQRRANVAGAFQARPRMVTGKCVLVVDDVTTSGATLEVCSSALLQAGASSVYALTLARAI